MSLDWFSSIEKAQQEHWNTGYQKGLITVAPPPPKRSGVTTPDCQRSDPPPVNLGGRGRRRRPKVLVVGDFMHDLYLLATADRISPEGPIPVLKVYESFVRPGGAGNVAANLRSLGVEVVEYPGATAFDAGLCPVKARIMVGDTQVARFDWHDRCLGPDIEKMLTEDVDAVVVADYLKGGITPDVVDAVAAMQLLTFVDTKGDPSPWLQAVSQRRLWLFPNSKEYDRYRAEYDQARNVVLKRGAQGLTHWSFGISSAHYPAKARFVRSVNGAGDTVVAGFVAQYLQGGDVGAALAVANAAAAVVVEKPYTATATFEEVEEVLARETRAGNSAVA